MHRVVWVSPKYLEDLRSLLLPLPSVGGTNDASLGSQMPFHKSSDGRDVLADAGSAPLLAVDSSEHCLVLAHS